jgi:cytochrome oxidase Cu insertion factor (SCO1/SenC/PrrC family)
MGGKAATRAIAAAQRRQIRRRRRWRRAALGIVAGALVAAALATWQKTRPRALIPVGATLPGFSLVDQEGQPLTRATLAGRAVVFGCAFFHDLGHDLGHDPGHDVARAPAPLREARALADELRRGPLAGRVAIVTLTAAPEEDSPDHLRAAAASAGATPPWSLASGAPAGVTGLLDALDVDWRRLASERARYGSPIFPDERLILVDGDGRVRGEYDAASWTAMRRLRAELRAIALAPPR